MISTNGSTKELMKKTGLIRPQPSAELLLLILSAYWLIAPLESLPSNGRFWKRLLSKKQAMRPKPEHSSNRKPKFILNSIICYSSNAGSGPMINNLKLMLLITY